MSDFLSIAGFILVLLGAAFCMIGGLGLIRMPDFYTRTHAVGVTDTFGAGFVLVGLMLHAPDLQVAIKLLMTLGFMLVTGPVASHAVAKAAYAQGVAVVEEPKPDEQCPGPERSSSEKEGGRGAAG